MPTKKHKQIARTTGIYFSAVIVAIASIFWVNALILAWTSPTSLPPADNVSAPLNTGATGQSKAGGLILNTGGAATGLIVDQGKVGIGETNPGAKLHVGGTAGTDGIMFPDGTLQTTAAAGGIARIKTGTYVGNGSNNRQINVGFRPKEVWIQDNNTAYWPQFRWDTMQAGVSRMTGSGAYQYNNIKSFNATGFTIGTDVGVNQSGHTYSYRALGE